MFWLVSKNHLYCPYGPGLTQGKLDEVGARAQMWITRTASDNEPKVFLKSLLDGVIAASTLGLDVVVWVCGDFYGDCLPSLLATCITSHSELIYYIAPVEKRTPGGYVSGWLSAAGHRGELANLMIETLRAVPSRLFLALVPIDNMSLIMHTCPFEKDFEFWIRLGVYIVIVDPDSPYAEVIGPAGGPARFK